MRPQASSSPKSARDSAPWYECRLVRDGAWWDALAGDLGAAAAGTPAGRVGRPDDVASAVFFIAGHELVTGAVLPIAGGVHLPTGR